MGGLAGGGEESSVGCSWGAGEVADGAEVGGSRPERSQGRTVHLADWNGEMAMERRGFWSWSMSRPPSRARSEGSDCGWPTKC